MELQLVYVGAAFPGIPCKAVTELHVVHKHRHTQGGEGGFPFHFLDFIY